MNEVSKDGKIPIYKKWWFWVIIVVALIGVAGAGSSKSDVVDGGSESREQPSSTNSDGNDPLLKYLGDYGQLAEENGTLSSPGKIPLITLSENGTCVSKNPFASSCKWVADDSVIITNLNNGEEVYE